MTWLPVDGDGAVDPDARRLRAAARHRAGLDHGRQRRDRHACSRCARSAAWRAVAACPFHVDGVGAIGRLPLIVDDAVIDLLTVSSNDLYGPPGAGALWVRPERAAGLPIVLGGGQEGAFARAPRTCRRSLAWAWPPTSRVTSARPKVARLSPLRDRLLEGLLEARQRRTAHRRARRRAGCRTTPAWSCPA